MKEENKKLSIGIPTFNREQQLKNQLSSIFKQDISNIEEIIIVDNHSEYDITNVVSEFDTNKIRLIKNPFNIKMSSNMASPFLYCKTEWLWLLSDDDETLGNSIENILSEIDVCASNTGMIKFSIARNEGRQKDYTVNNLNEYIDYYYTEGKIRRGDLVFISTNVYNINNIEDFLGYAFEYSYSYISFLIPVFYALDCKRISVRFSSTEVVSYISPHEGNYSFGMVGKGLSILSHLPLMLTKEYRKKFLDCTMSITYKGLMIIYLKEGKQQDFIDFKIMYNNIYRYYISLPSKIAVYMFYIMMSTKPSRLFASWLFRRLYKK